MLLLGCYVDDLTFVHYERQGIAALEAMVVTDSQDKL
jgi:hypothetical protein